jgi:cell division protein FtsW
MNLRRYNNNFFNSWWWTVDHFILIALAVIVAISAVMVATASPAVADRIGLESFYFIRRQLLYLLISIIIIFGISCLSPLAIRRFSCIGVAICIVLLIAVLFFGPETKGARRWLYIFGFSLQPSEFIKPFFAVVVGWILSQRFYNHEFPAFKVSIFCYLIIISLLILQPDFGMVVTISMVWAGQLFLAGLPLTLIFAASIMAIVGVIGAYFFLPHVTKRIDNFLDPASSENYQVKKSLEAFQNGGLYGKGPGEGIVKQSLPDSHTDFVFAVVGEELGVITCIIIVMLFAIIIIRGLTRLSQESDHFIVLATTGLLMQFGIQAFINMGVTLHLLPTKGMTLPLISYGGSSMFAVSIGLGIILAMTRRRYSTVKIGARGYKLWLRS